MIKFCHENSGVVSLSSMQEKVRECHRALHGKSGVGNEFTGWLHLPISYDEKEFAEIKEVAHDLRATCDVMLVCGIGGSYLGARAGLEFVKGGFSREVIFVGNSISSDYLADLIDYIKDKKVCLNVISKSGTTLEPALAFRFLREIVPAERIVATTDKNKGALKKLAGEKGYKTFVVPDDVGGRYSVLTAVGLLPLAFGGVDINELMKGAREAMDAYSVENLEENECYQYAAVRNILHENGKNIEILASFEPSLQYFAEWWKQLFGESEGKDGKGIYPASALFSTDLHSMGQYIQDGKRHLFETVIKIAEPTRDLQITRVGENGDGLEFIEGKTVGFVNEMARLGTQEAHVSGGVPNLLIDVPKRDARCLGQLIYFFEKACAISGYLLGVNPFDQPGVEEYKKNMFKLLGK